MGLILAALASLFATMNNFAQRRSLDKGGTCKGFVVIQLLGSFSLIVILNVFMASGFALCKEVVILGVIGGLIQGLLTWSVGKTIEKGPAALTFAILFGSSTVPALLFFLCFGPLFGYNYTIWNALGSILVIAGLFWAAKKSSTTNQLSPKEKGWGKFMSLSFGSHALILVYFGLWAFILEGEHPIFSSIDIKESEALWFTPIMLFVGAIVQLACYIAQERRLFTKRELGYGLGGGLCHGLCSFFLVLAPQKALPWENAMLFPTYAVLIIIGCNLWAQFVYKEKVHWKASTLSFSGLILGTMGS